MLLKFLNISKGVTLGLLATSLLPRVRRHRAAKARVNAFGADNLRPVIIVNAGPVFAFYFNAKLANYNCFESIAHD